MRSKKSKPTRRAATMGRRVVAANCAGGGAYIVTPSGFPRRDLAGRAWQVICVYTHPCRRVPTAVVHIGYFPTKDVAWAEARRVAAYHFVDF